jgi:hypothetical protein
LAGGGQNGGYGIAVDASGNAYVSGYTAATDFPLVNPIAPPTTGNCHASTNGLPPAPIENIYVTKIAATGSALVYSTFLGGSCDGNGFGVALDSLGNAFITGWTSSADFPTTPGAFQPTYGGGGPFLTVLNPSGSALVYSTYLGGIGSGNALSIALDAAGNAYVTGFTESTNFPTTPGAFQTIYRSLAATGFVAKFAPSPNVGLSPSSANFANQEIGSTSARQTVTLTNTGNLDLSITSIGLTGANSSDFTEANACPISPTTLAPGGTCTIKVAFTPAAAGTRTASVTITDNAPDSAQTISLTGTGTPIPTVSVSPASLTFLPEPIGVQSAVQTVTLSNTSPIGATTFTISSIGTSGDFAQTNNCGNSVAIGASCGINVTFTPTGPNTRTGTLTITDNATTSPQSVALTGTGTGPVVSLSPASLSFGSQLLGTTSGAQSVTVSNTGNMALTLSIVSSGDYAQTNNCGGSVAAGASCSISVTFAPAATGARTGALTLTDNASTSPQTVALSGTGTGPVVGLAPASLSFSNQLLGTASSSQTLAVNNTGNMALTISSIVASGDYAQTNTCGSSVAAGANCTISATFTPTATGPRTGTITVTDNAFDSPQIVNLSGTGIAPAVTPSPSSLTFPAQYVGTSGLPQNVTISNTGTAPLTITNVQASSSFGETSGCTSSLPINVSCTIGVFFDPTASGNITGTLTITDNAPGSPHTVALSGTGQDFNLAPASGSITMASVSRGQAATYTLTLAPGGGFNQTVSLTCAGAPSESSCTVSPGVVTLDPTTATTVVVTVTTTAASMVAPRFGTPPGAPGLMISMARRWKNVPLFIWIFALAITAGIGWGWGTRVRSRALSPIRLGFGLLLLFVVMLGVISAPACGGGGGGGGGGGNPGTPAGTYNLNVTGTFASGTTTLTHNVKLVLTVF